MARYGCQETSNRVRAGKGSWLGSQEFRALLARDPPGVAVRVKATARSFSSHLRAILISYLLECKNRAALVLITVRNVAGRGHAVVATVFPYSPVHVLRRQGRGQSQRKCAEANGRFYEEKLHPAWGGGPSSVQRETGDTISGARLGKAGFSVTGEREEFGGGNQQTREQKAVITS